MSEGGEQENQRGLNRKSYNRLRYPMSEGGEQENQRGLNRIVTID